MAAVAASQPAGTRIAGAAALLLGGFALSRLLGLLREVVLSAQFGTGVDYDLYLAAFRIPDAVFTLVAGGALGSTLVPVFAERMETGKAAGAARLAGAVFSLVTVAAGLAAAAGMLLAPQLAPLLGGGFAPAEQARLVLLMRVLLLQPVLLAMSEVVGRYLNVRGHFLAPALAPALYNVPVIAAALLLGPQLGTAGLAAGVVAGAVLYLLVQLPAALRHGFRPAPALTLADPGLRQIGRLMVPRMVGQGAVQLSFILTTRLASYLPEGSISALNFAWILTMLALGPLAMSLGNAALPTMSAQAARGEGRAMAETVRRTLGAIVFLVVPAALVLIVAGRPIVETLFERNAFDDRSSAHTAAALAVYAAGLPAHGAIEILTRAFYAVQDTRTPVAAGVLAMVLNVALAYATAGTLGYLGIALAMSVSASLEAVLLLALLARRAPGVAGMPLLWTAGRIALAAAGLVLACAPAVALARGAGLPAPAQAVAALAAAGAGYLVGSLAVRSPELDGMIRLVRAKVGR